MKFPLADWIDDHHGVRHDLAQSGMIGSLRRPALTAADRRATDPRELRRALAGRLGVAADRVLLTHGASEANGWTAAYLARAVRPRAGVCRTRHPEYPPLSDGPRSFGFRVVTDGRPADLAVVSRPRNPEGDSWSQSRLLEWAKGARHLLVDETFREFGDERSLASIDRPGLWVTGTFTKFYAGDDLRVGFVVPPPEEAERFGRFLGVVADAVAPTSVAGAMAALRHHREIRAAVDRVLNANRRALVRAFPGTAPPVAPVWFDRTGSVADRLAERLLRASVLVCPGRFFGDPNGVRLCLTRRTFPRDLAAYLRVRDAVRPRGLSGETPTGRTARPRLGGTVQRRAARG